MESWWNTGEDSSKPRRGNRHAGARAASKADKVEGYRVIKPLYPKQMFRVTKKPACIPCYDWYLPKFCAVTCYICSSITSQGAAFSPSGSGSITGRHNCLLTKPAGQISSAGDDASGVGTPAGSTPGLTCDLSSSWCPHHRLGSSIAGALLMPSPLQTPACDSKPDSHALPSPDTCMWLQTWFVEGHNPPAKGPIAGQLATPLDVAESMHLITRPLTRSSATTIALFGLQISIKDPGHCAGIKPFPIWY